MPQELSADALIQKIAMLEKELANSREAEALLQKRLKDYVLLFENSEDYILISDHEAKPVMWNSAYARIIKTALGVDVKPGIPTHYLLPDKKLTAWWDRLRDRVFSGETFRKEFSYDFGEGDIRYFELSYCPIMEDGTVKGFSEVTRDITNRKKAEIALKESEKKYRMLFEGIRNGIVLLEAIYDADGNICDARYIEMNHVYQVYTGLTREKANGRTVMEMLPATQKRWLDTLDIAIKKGKLIRFEMYHEGTQKHYAVSAYSPGGNMVVGVFRDITREKEVEQEKLKMQEKLNRSQKMEAMGLMAGGVAHDLNNLLSSVISYPELLLMNPAFPDNFRRPVERIKEGGLRAAAIVSDMLTIARGVASRKEIAGINKMISDYLDSFEHQEMMDACPDIVIETKLAPNLHPIVCSPVHMRKVLMNLVSNAMESVKSGGKIVISTRNQNLDNPVPGYADVRAGAYAVLSVADTGGGISSEDMPHIFEPFYSKKKMGRSGTGLGLTVVWNTVEDHQGYIHVDSGASGTRFDLYFPASGMAAGDSTVNSGRRASSLKGSGQKVLVVDDEESQREIARQILMELGYQVETAASGEKALAYLKGNAVDLIVLDMVMGTGMNGRQTYQEALRIHPGQKAIIVSGFAETAEVREVQRLGAGQFVKKPYMMDTIGAAVKAELLR